MRSGAPVMRWATAAADSITPEAGQVTAGVTNWFLVRPWIALAIALTR